MTKVEVKKNYYQYSPSPLDLNFQVEIKFIDEDESVKYVYAIYESNYSEYGIITKSIFEPMKRPESFEPFIVESYQSLDDTVNSAYASLFDDVDFVLDKYVDQITSEIEDTKYSGPRCSAKIDSKGLTYYSESCSYISKEDKYYYIQVTKNNGKYHYSVSDKSTFMRTQLGAMYSIVFGDYSEVEYYVSSDNVDDLEAITYMKEDALKLKDFLDEFITSQKDND